MKKSIVCFAVVFSLCVFASGFAFPVKKKLTNKPANLRSTKEAACPPEILNEWVQTACETASHYTCPLWDSYDMMFFGTEPTDTWQFACIAEANAAVKQTCGDTFGWLNGGCGYDSWGHGCTLWFYCL